MPHKSWEEIFFTMQSRRENEPELIRMMQEVQVRYNNDLVIPLPDVEGNPTLPVSAPALVAEAVDNLGMRAASTQPVIWTPQTGNSVAAGTRASRRRKVWMGRWRESGLNDALMARAYRQWFAYGVPCLGVYPRLDDYGGARIELMNPLTTYPEPRANEEHRPPADIGMIYGRSRAWLAKAYGNLPGVASILETWDKTTGGAEVLWDVVEWFDDMWRVFGLIGPRHSYETRATEMFYRAHQGFTGALLSRVPNRAEMVPFVAPRRVGLDRTEGQVAKMLGTQDLLGRMYALHYKAGEKQVFPDMVVLGDQTGSAPELVSGRWIDGREGQANLVMNARAVNLLQPQESVSSYMTTDRLERSARITGGSSPLQHGESPGASIRTGRGFDTMASFSIDPFIGEAHRIMARNLGTINEAIAKTEMGYFGSKKLFVFSGSLGDEERVEYTPDDIFGDTCDSVVQYQFPGADVSSVTVAVAQLAASGMMSKATGRAKHPFIDDPDGEERQDMIERLVDATVAGLQQLASTGEIPPADLASIVRHVKVDRKEIFEAIELAQKEAQERQATPAPDPGEGQLPPEMMPGLSMPGMGAEQPPPNATHGIPDQSDTDMARLNRLMFDLRNSANPAPGA